MARTSFSFAFLSFRKPTHYSKWDYLQIHVFLSHRMSDSTLHYPVTTVAILTRFPVHIMRLLSMPTPLRDPQEPKDVGTGFHPFLCPSPMLLPRWRNRKIRLIRSQFYFIVSTRKAIRIYRYNFGSSLCKRAVHFSAVKQCRPTSQHNVGREPSDLYTLRLQTNGHHTDEKHQPGEREPIRAPP